MSMLEKLFGDISMTWKKVIIFAVITGCYTGGVNLIPFLKDTSFQDIAVTTEWWIFFAIIIAANCKKPVESGLKIFVFFLISQPLVYLVEMPFLGTGVWGYYKYWAIITVLTLPGGMIANFIRKKSVWGTIILSVALCILAVTACEYTFRVITSFPHHILTVIFCLLQISLLILCLIPRVSFRLLAVGVASIAFLVSGYIAMNTKNTIDAPLPDGEAWTCTFENTDKSTLSCTEDILTMTYSKAFVKENSIICKDKNGQTVKYKVTVSADRIVTLIQE